MNSKNELADKLKKEAEHFSGAQDLVEMLLDAEALIRNLHTENTALRVTEDNLRQELQECQDQRRAAFRRIEELERQLDEARKDAERLDYIQKNARSDPKMDGNHVWWPTTLNQAQNLKGPTIRAAIDATMQKGQS